MRKIIKKVAKGVLSKTPTSCWLRFAKNSVYIPFYHIITDDFAPHIHHLYKYRNTKKFEDDLDFFSKNFNLIDIHQLLDFAREKKQLPPRPLLLTFDDGLREMYDVVRPILLKKSCPAVFFINNSFVDNKDLFYKNKASLLVDYISKNGIGDGDLKFINSLIEAAQMPVNDELKNTILSLKYLKNTEIFDDIANRIGVSFDDFLRKTKPYLTSEQISQMQQDGFAIGAHSFEHQWFGNATTDEQIAQIGTSINQLADKFNIDYKIFAFPFNDHSVSHTFFEEVENKNVAEITFGADGILPDEAPKNFQRFWMENSHASVEQIFKTEMGRKLVRRLKNKDLITRD